MTRSTTASSRRRADGLLIAVFLAAIWLPLCGMALRSEAPLGENFENRHLAEIPAFKLQPSSLLTFPTRFDAYFQDQFGGRRTLVRWNNLATIYWLGMTPTAPAQQDPYDSLAQPGSALVAIADTPDPPVSGSPNTIATALPAPQAIVGKHGWLFYAAAGTLDYYRRVRTYQPHELDAWQRVFVERRDWLAVRGIPFLVIIAPNKHTIYPEHMPATIHRFDRPSHLDRWQERMNAVTGPQISYDLRPALLASKSQQRSYHRTDTHWNAYGAHIAYTELMRAVAERVNVAPPWPLDAFNITLDERPGGDLAKMLGLPDVYREEWIELVPRKSRLASTLLQERTTYNLHILQHPDSSLPRAVVFHDSFFTRLTPFVAEHFSRLTQAYTYEFDTNLIEREQPDIVIQQLVERTMARFIPKNPAALQPLLHTVASPQAEEPRHR